MKKRTTIVESSATLRNRHRTSVECFKYMVGILSITMIFFAGCNRDVIVPQHLRGEWKTSAPKYADRSMKFSEHTVIYGIGDGEEVAYTIDKIDSQRSDDGTVYIFYYRDAEGQKETLILTYRPNSGGTLQIKNSQAIWEKGASGKAGG
jgi:hypothetical protein